MEIKISQVVAKMPEKVTRLCSHTENDDCCVACMSHDLVNGTIDKCGNLPISKDKVIGMVNMDEKELRKIIIENSTGKGFDIPSDYIVKVNVWQLADAIIAAKSDILTIKGDV